MGLFGQRQSDPVEWAGLPSEPAEPESAAERLADGPPVDAGGIGFGAVGLGGGTVELVVLAVPPATPVAEPQEPGGED